MPQPRPTTTLAPTDAGPGWTADPLVLLNTPTSDGRMIEELDWRELPLPLRWTPVDDGGHQGAVVVGRIDSIVQTGDRIVARGVFDDGSEHAVEVVRLIEGGFIRGVSVDLTAVEVEFVEDDDGNELMVCRSGQIAAATLVDIPAFEDAQVTLTESAEDEAAAIAVELGVEPTPVRAARPLAEVGVTTEWAGFSVIASGSTPAPPRRYFDDPGLDRRTGFHVGERDADGWVPVYGHIYGWGECHLGSPPGRCVSPPRGSTARGLFAGIDGRGVLTAEGDLVATGPITLSADHASLSDSWLAAKDHYANTGLAVADVAAGEDDHGIWVAGVVRPGVPEEHVYALRASGPSGDWRAVGGALELVAILAVNMQGFPALAASIDGAQVMALVASGGPTEPACGCGGGSSELAALRAELAPVVAFARSAAAEAIERDLLDAQRPRRGP